MSFVPVASLHIMHGGCTIKLASQTESSPFLADLSRYMVSSELEF